MLAVVVANARDLELQFECRRFGTTVSELRHLLMVAGKCCKGSCDGIDGAVLEASVVGLEGHCRLHLAKRGRIVVPEAVKPISGMRNAL